MQAETAVLLHNVRSSHNVGSIFRTADASGVSRIYLTGYTPRPIDRFGRPSKEIAKTALGAEAYLHWEYAKDPQSFLAVSRQAGWRIVGVEQDARAHDYRSFHVSGPTLFVLGNEVRGLSRELRRQCDELIEIPMRGKKESLNVSVAAGIILFTCTAVQ
jgi:23S rRNA (guanosine2251-2'-O)-methyltransferase